ncbi:MAG: CDP-diacylglycerol--serine O-phosphatidyltransferase [Alphaproteobacteria bacterium]
MVFREKKIKKLSTKSIQSKTLKALPFHKFIPNILTLTALCAGLSAVHFALKGKWETSLVLIFIAMVFDGMDGRIARLLNSTSKFGAELDSLADFCNFGIVPGLVIYIHSLEGLGRLGWPIVLMYSICMVLRLARFNTLIDQSPSPKYFSGVPAPFGALLALLPIIVEFHEPGWVLSPALYGVWLLVISSLLVSRIPTFSFKQGHVQKKWILPIFILVAFIVAGLVAYPWATLSIISLLYILSIPFSYRLKNQESLPSNN